MFKNSPLQGVFLPRFPSPCGVRRVRDPKAPRRFVPRPKVSVPLRGKEGAGLISALSPQVSWAQNVSVPLRGKEGAGLIEVLKTQNYTFIGGPSFRPLAG